MRRGLLGAAAVVVALGVPVAPAGSQHGPDATSAPAIPVSIGFASVTPPRTDVVRGEMVTWTNDSVRTHTVTADDRRFDSGRIVPQERFAHTFDELGEVAYHCSLHPFIRGVVGVHTVLLAAPDQAAAPNRPFPLSGRAALPAGTSVAIQADQGAGFAASRPPGRAQQQIIRQADGVVIEHPAVDELRGCGCEAGALTT